MVRPSNPRLMARVLDAVANLGDTKGSSARDVLDLIRRSNVSAKNLAVQVRRALKHAVTAGLLRHRSGRYKILATLNPVSTPAPPTKNSVNNDQKTKEKKVKPDALDSDMKSSHQTQEHKKGSTSQQRSNGRRKRKSRRSPSTRRANTTAQNRKRRQRKRTYEDQEFENLSSGRYISFRRDDESPVTLNRRTKRSRLSEREFESDFSDESDHESRVNRKRISRANDSLHHRQPKRHKKTRARSRDRSTSRARTPQVLQRTMQARQHTIEEVGNDVPSRYEEDHGSTERDVTPQETHEDVDGAEREPNDTNSGSVLENS